MKKIKTSREKFKSMKEAVKETLKKIMNERVMDGDGRRKKRGENNGKR